MKKKVVAVSDVNRYVARLLDEDYVLGDVWLQGEVSNCKYHSSGHIYFTMKDHLASIPAVMFEKDAKKLIFQLEEGMNICARCRISLYEKSGTYQAYVKEIDGQGKGTLYEAFEKLKKALLEEGLFSEAYKKPLPLYPKAVGVITSPTGAAIKDILEVASRRNNAIPIYVYPTHVQGPLAAKEMIQAIQRANKEQRVDVLIIGRGGGAIEDLWCFNDEALARAIFQSQIPVVSAVGHEVDFTIADFVSDRRAPTPSAASEIVFPSKEGCLHQINQYQHQLKQHLLARIQHHNQRLTYLQSRPVFAQKERYFQERMQYVDERVDKLQRAYANQLMSLEKNLHKKITQLETLSPLATLKRGYTLTHRMSDDTLIRSSEALQVGDELRITFDKGYVISRVEKKG